MSCLPILVFPLHTLHNDYLAHFAVATGNEATSACNVSPASAVVWCVSHAFNPGYHGAALNILRNAIFS